MPAGPAAPVSREGALVRRRVPPSVVDPVNGTGFDPMVAAAALGLTRMEGRVAVLLSQGMRVQRIAAVTAGFDYRAVSGTLVFPKEETTKSVWAEVFPASPPPRAATRLPPVLDPAAADFGCTGGAHDLRAWSRRPPPQPA